LKRLFDILIAGLLLITLSPLLLLIAIWVSVDSNGGILFRQWRIGKYGKPFRIWKFRTMYPNADAIRSITISATDNRITKAGLVLRKYKLDELPQLYNVLTGTMSLVGPRPELKKYVDLYSKHQLKVLSIKPGITDIASLVFSNENELLSGVDEPELFYKEKVVPLKLKLNRIYVVNHSTGNYFLFRYWSILHLLHIPCARIQQMERNCKGWMHTTSGYILSSARSIAKVTA
jgi:lipopolysaccharide/colanic/teichoic acid biosynthesis glycosyltransferase